MANVRSTLALAAVAATLAFSSAAFAETAEKAADGSVTVQAPKADAAKVEHKAKHKAHKAKKAAEQKAN